MAVQDRPCRGANVSSIAHAVAWEQMPFLRMATGSIQLAVSRPCRRVLLAYPEQDDTISWIRFGLGPSFEELASGGRLEAASTCPKDPEVVAGPRGVLQIRHI